MTDQNFKVVVTGFGPFQDVPVNESWRAVSGLWDEKLPDKIKLITRELPVVYEIVRKQVEDLWDQESPDLMIHVGVSKNDTQISLEKHSFNACYELKDINNQCPANQCCLENSAETLSTKLDVEDLCKVSNAIFCQQNSKAHCGSSVDPGRYLCAFTYYLSLSKDSKKSLFVHVPSEKTFSIHEMTIALKSIIIQSLNQLYNANLD
ncbi:pyroglutamyl-peptidase 1 [Brachionus plicatilis]|uniref:Pyroglutamyl-peptidase 1 n=1 Tax=Brachionus plicatilis TaxID=10195 RepID=A0A3M7Q1H9_BRAPC|nr:pyroglutamyl-peptidase 1 [Brachionus plicatilis]